MHSNYSNDRQAWGFIIVDLIPIVLKDMMQRSHAHCLLCMQDNVLFYLTLNWNLILLAQIYPFASIALTLRAPDLSYLTTCVPRNKTRGGTPWKADAYSTSS